MFTLALTCVFLISPLVALAAQIVPCGDQTNEATGVVSNPCNFDHFILGIKNIIDYLLLISGSIATLIFAYAGVLILTAGGKEDQVKDAKRMFWSVLKGFALMLSAWLIVKFILTGLGVPDAFSLLQ